MPSDRINARLSAPLAQFVDIWLAKTAFTKRPANISAT
jgi:hypothetical protein